MMGKKEKQAYLAAIRRRYRRADRKGKGSIPDEFCGVCGYKRKYAIRILNHQPSPSSARHVGRKPICRDDERKFQKLPARVIKYFKYPKSLKQHELYCD